MANSASKLTYAELSKKLEQSLEWFESGDLDVDQASTKYQEVLELIAQMEARLKAAKNKITKAK